MTRFLILRDEFATYLFNHGRSPHFSRISQVQTSMVDAGINASLDHQHCDEVRLNLEVAAKR
ncbi:unannotated protein [freshwater metagenome]|uniref:Unannotated protein n=1 Tax=freshwater metagenome TaxID=449393 RepID=A0A6J7ALP2_9ZZZZ